MNEIQAKILKTIIYLDMFDFAPTLLEVQKWLLKIDNNQTGAAQNKSPLTISSLAPSLVTLQKQLTQISSVNTQNGFYFLHGREKLTASRQQKYDFTEKKCQRVRPFLRLLATMPHVQAIWLTNAMGWGNAQAKSDIDLFIITTPGKIWTARFFTTTLMKLLRQRPGEQRPEKAICLSMYLAADNLNLAPYQISSTDIHFAFWTNQVYPVYDAGAKNPNQGVYQQYQTANDPWLRDYFSQPQWAQSIGRAFIKISGLEKCLKKILQLGAWEKIFKYIQLKILPAKLRNAATNQSTTVVLRDNIIKLHINDPRKKLQQELAKRFAAFIPK